MKRILLVIAFLALAVPAALWAGESVTRTKPGRPDSTPLFTKRSVVAGGAVTDLCTLTDGRECVIINQTDQDLCIKVPSADPTCGSTNIDCDADTDILLVPRGQSWSHVLEKDGTVCGTMLNAPTGNCSVPSSTRCVYSVEVEP